ncbi:hypothetical protein RND81_14G250000 [Saponaria officinalis]|uniref:RING-type domain-containing protein n=1 Tax=Saponaria officinalis TaxID=3572 RepID=A0AAW1GUA8_SAPOF
MGAACCVAARDRTINHGSSGEIVQRNIRHSASWSFRFDSRVGVAGEDSSKGSMSDVASRNDAPDVKFASDVSAHVSDAGSSMESYQTAGSSSKSPLNHERAENVKPSPSDRLISGNSSTEAKAESSQSSVSASIKQPPLIHTSSLSASPLPSQSKPLSPAPLPSTSVQGPPQRCLRQQPSEIHSSGRSSPVENRHVPSRMSTASNESTRGSFGRSSDGSSAHAFSDVRSVSQRGRCSFDSGSSSSARDKSSRNNGRDSGSTSVNFPSCGICSKQLSEKSAWGSEKIAGGNELEVIAVLICGHVYHAECLETITPEANKYDPACPVCAFGEKQTLKLTGKLLKAERDFKVKNIKKLRNQEADIDGSFDFDYWKSSPAQGNGPKLLNSSSLRISTAKPFLKRHFSFGSRSDKSPSVSPSLKKKGVFWAKSSRV